MATIVHEFNERAADDGDYCYYQSLTPHVRSSLCRRPLESLLLTLICAAYYNDYLAGTNERMPCNPDLRRRPRERDGKIVGRRGLNIGILGRSTLSSQVGWRLSPVGTE